MPLAGLTGTAVWYVLRSKALSLHLASEKQRADTDSLTGLLNRAAFNKALKKHFANNAPLALIYMDLSNFKDINDTLGHAAGDAVLRRFSETLRRHTGESAIPARVGGDEFCLLIPGADEEAGVAVADRIRSELVQPFNVMERTISVDMGIGVAWRSDDCLSADELMRRADRAMYESKQDANLPRTYEPGMDESRRIQREIRDELGAAFDAGQLAVAYQPLIDARSGELVAAEALMRWPSKIGPAGSPGAFIPIAEETGLIIELGDWVLRETLKRIRDFGNLPIAVNVSPRQFLTNDFAKRVADAIIEAGVDPSLLKIEITEGVLITHTQSAQRVLKQLSDIGVQLLLDDFGTGFSSLSNLRNLPFDRLKIDRSFITNIAADPNNQLIVEGILTLAQGLKAPRAGLPNGVGGAFPLNVQAR